MLHSPPRFGLRQLGLALCAWALAWGLMLALEHRLELANLVLLPVLAGAMASIWLPTWASMLLSLLSVLAFSWHFVPPQGSLEVGLPQHGLLLGSMLSLNWVTAMLMSRLSRQASLARLHAQRAEQLRAFSEGLRDASSPLQQAPLLLSSLVELSDQGVRLMLLIDALPASNDDSAVRLFGPAPDSDQHAGLWACLRQGSDFGPGTGRHEELPCWYLPLRGRQGAHGAALLAIDDPLAPDTSLRRHAQLLCDQFGLALERLASERQAQRARDEAESQATRNALLAAISHDYRTPLATILGAASSLLEQGERLAPAQQRRLCERIIDETRQLNRMTDNTLQLARLDAPGVALQLDWESAEDIVGAVLRRVRERQLDAERARRLRARVEPGLPLLRCDALLLTQLLENLVDNALKYAEDSPVELLVRLDSSATPAQLVLAVRDRGPGVTPAWRERIFEVFQRGSELDRERPDAGQRRGAGVGLAACRAIARAHGGEMRYRARSHGGSSFECCLPLQALPEESLS